MSQHKFSDTNQLINILIGWLLLRVSPDWLTRLVVWQMTLGSLQCTWRVAEPSVSKYKRRQSTNGVFSSELTADTEACLCECVYVCASVAAKMFVMSSTCCVVPGCRQANGLLQECEFRLVESEGLVHHMWRGFNIHLADRQRLSVFPAEQHLQNKHIACNLHKF